MKEFRLIFLYHHPGLLNPILPLKTFKEEIKKITGIKEENQRV